MVDTGKHCCSDCSLNDYGHSSVDGTSIPIPTTTMKLRNVKRIGCGKKVGAGDGAESCAMLSFGHNTAAVYRDSQQLGLFTRDMNKNQSK